MVPNGVCNYLIYSDELAFENTDMVNIMFRRINNVYQLKVFVDYGFTTDNGNMWYGSTRPPYALLEKYDNWINTDEKIHRVGIEEFTEYLDEEEPIDAMLNDLWLGGD